MEDWTDIIGEELEKFQEPLPADDWKVLQQKYTATRRRKRRAAFVWAGGIASVAAAVLLVLVLVLGEAPVVQENMVADNLQPTETSVLPEEETAQSGEEILQLVEENSMQAEECLQPKVETIRQAKKDVSSDTDNAKAVEKVVADVNADVEISETGAEAVKVVSDTTSLAQKLIAEASAPAKDNNKSDNVAQSVGAWDFEDYREDEINRKRRPVSLGVVGAVSGSGVIRFMSSFDGYPIESPISPEDSLSTVAAVLTRSKTESNRDYTYTDSYRHNLPIAVGVSARFYISDRMTLNTGLNYTKYISRRGKYYHKTGEHTRVEQCAHYLGVPLRFDWIASAKPYFNFYMGAGVQIDKCVYAVIENERLYENQILFSFSGVMGFQVNIMPLVGIYFEPEVSYNVNKGTIETLRSDLKLMVSARGGLRFNF